MAAISLVLFAVTARAADDHAAAPGLDHAAAPGLVEEAPPDAPTT